MSFTLTQLLTSFKSAFQNNSGTIRNTTIALIVFGMNAVIQSEDFFQCPPKNFVLYGSCFFVFPAVFLFMVTIFLHNGFWSFVRGCCFYEGRQKRGTKRYCPCFYPRWGCTKAFAEVLVQSSVSSVIWIFWALLQRDYYICAALGGSKEIKLAEAGTEEEKLKIEEDYANAGRNSQIIALSLLGGSLVFAFTFLLIYRSSCQREIGSLPSPYQYQKLESDAAVAAFTANMEKLAREQGKRRADLYFATLNKKNPSELIKKAYEDLIEVNKFNEAFPSLEDYQSLQAQAAVTAFKEKVQKEGKEKVELTFVDTTWREYEERDAFALVNNAYDEMAERYPRSTGDRSKPFVKEEKVVENSASGSYFHSRGKVEDVEMAVRT